jgi:hypothetical protein
MSRILKAKVGNELIPIYRNVNVTYQGNSFPNISGKAQPGEILMICIDNGGANGFAIQTTSNGTYDIEFGDGQRQIGVSATAFTTQATANNLTAQVSHTYVENNGSGLGVWIPEWKVWAYTVRIYNASSDIKYFKVAKTSAQYTQQNSCVAWAEINVPSLVDISQMWSNGVAISPLRSPFLKKVNIYDASNVTSSDYFAYNCGGFEDFNFPAMPLATSRTYAIYGTGLVNGTMNSLYSGGGSASYTYYLSNSGRVRTFSITASDWGSTGSTAYMFDTSTALDEVHLPAGVGNDKNTNCTNMFYLCGNLKHITNLEFLGSRTQDCSMTSIFYRCENLAQSLTIGAKLSKLSLGGSSTVPLPITGLILTNANSTFGGSSPQLDIQYCSGMDAPALNAFFTSLPTQPVGSNKAIKITGCAGAGTCDTSIATAKNYIVQN